MEYCPSLELPGKGYGVIRFRRLDRLQDEYSNKLSLGSCARRRPVWTLVGRWLRKRTYEQISGLALYGETVSSRWPS